MLLRKCIFLLMNIALVTSAREPSCPACSRYDFEERLLERVLRNELVIETMLKEIRETNGKVESALKLMQEDRSRLEDSLNGLEISKTEMDTELKGTLQGALKNVSDSLAFIKYFQEEKGTKLDSTIETAMINISNAVSEMKRNATMTGLQLKKENEILKDQLMTPSIYFHAYTAADQSLDAGQDIVYRNVRVNEGQGYNTTTGRYTVSVPGLYVFTVHLALHNPINAYLGIVHQGTKIQPSYTHLTSGGIYMIVSLQVFIRAAMSDQIWVKSLSQPTQIYDYDNSCNSFTGALIHL